LSFTQKLIFILKQAHYIGLCNSAYQEKRAADARSRFKEWVCNEKAELFNLYFD